MSRLQKMLAISFRFGVLAVSSLAWTLVPGDLHHRDPLLPALYHNETFENRQAPVPNTLEDAKVKLETLLQSDPSNANAHRALAEIHVKMLDFTAAETHIKTYAEKTGRYEDLESYYMQRLEFGKAVEAIQKEAATLELHPSDVENNNGRYGLYKSILDKISTYHLPIDPSATYRLAIDSYPASPRPYLEYIQYLKETDKQKAVQELETFRQRFPSETTTYLLTKASLLGQNEASDLLNKSFDPLWNQELYRAFDRALIETDAKREYLNSLTGRLKKEPLDIDAVARLFHAYHLAGNLMEAQNALNDYRLLKEQSVQQKKSSWSAKDLFWMASLNEKILNYNEAARFYYSLYSVLAYKKDLQLQPDMALNGLFRVLIAAEDRPVQLSAGNLDYYKDIATMDQNPGILNGILSLILNGKDLQSEFQYQEDKANGYFNRAEALRLVRFTQKHYPQSPHLAGMYRDSLRIYEKYGMDELLVDAGEAFFQKFSNSNEVFDVGVAVTDAYARMKNQEKEWNTYRFLLPLAAQRNQSRSLIAAPTSEETDEYTDGQAKQQIIDYEFLLNRYIASLTREKRHLDVVRLYQQEIEQHPDEEALYESFAAYLTQNQLFEEEKQLYQQAIQKFQGKGWYEKLARWYLRFQKNQEYEKLSQEMMDIFRGTEIEAYLQQTTGSTSPLYFALNLYAHEKFPLNITFVQNLLTYYQNEHRDQEWEALAAQHYFLDDSIRSAYLQRLSATNKLPREVPTSNAVYTLFAGDVATWRSHFEEAALFYDQLSRSYPADPQINIRLADLKRSLGVQDLQNYFASASIRQRLATTTPSDSALWTTAGETMADIERYEDSKKYWEQILRIDPYNPERYIEVATIYWDYYLFDDALNTIAKIRNLRNEPDLFAYESGAIYESKREYQNAIAEYAKSLSDGSEMAWHRLGELYKRKKFTSAIQKQIEAQLKKDPQNEKIWSGTLRFYAEHKEKDLLRQFHARAIQTLKPEPFRNVAEILKRQTRDLGMNEQHEDLIQRQIKDAPSELEKWNRMLELARFHEASKQQDLAGAIYLGLYREQPKSAGLIQELVSYYWRTGQYPGAFDVYKEALKQSNAVWRKTYLQQIAARYRERKDLSSALTHARQLWDMEPLNAQNFQLVAEILAEQSDYAALAAHYKNGLKLVQESKLSAEEKKQRTADLRKGIVRANVILKDYTAALDQYIEVINRDAESEEDLKEAAGFAKNHGLSTRLFEYYSKTASASPKDHRWPMVLGRLYLYSGDFPEAIRQFQIAIAIRPERTDFHEQVAESYQRLGKYEDALRAYETVYELSYKNKRWLIPMSELHARSGRQDKALAMYGETLQEMSPMRKNFSLAQKALEWGSPEKAAAYGKAGLDLYYKDMSAPFEVEGFQTYLEALLRSGKTLASFSTLRTTSQKISSSLTKAQFDAEELRSAQYMVNDVYSNRYPEMLRKYLLADDWKQLEDAIFQAIQQQGGYRAMYDSITLQYLPMVRAARMAPAEERILRQLADYHNKRSFKQEGTEWSRYMQYRAELLRFYDRRQQWAQAARWLDAEYQTYRTPYQYREDLPQIAQFYRLAEMPDQELVALRRYYAFGTQFDLRQEPVYRYLDLLYERNAANELKQAAAQANLISTNYFFSMKDEELSLAAIRSLHSRYKNDPSWQTIQLAMVGWQIRQPRELFDASFQTALDHRTTGELLGSPLNIEAGLEGDPWFYYEHLHGEYLHHTNRKEEAAYHLNGDLEGLSTSAARQDQLGNFYKREGEFQKALDHFELALELDQNNLEYFDHQARALIAMGKKQEAIEIWKSLLAKEEYRNELPVWHIVLNAATESGFLPEVQQSIADFISRRIQQGGLAGNSGLVQVYLRAIDEQARVQHVQTWIPTAPSPVEFGKGLLAGSFGTRVDLAVYSTVHSYLESRSKTAVGQEQSVVRNEFWKWNQRYAEELARSNSHSKADEILRTLQEQFETADEHAQAYNVALLRAKIFAETNRTDEAWHVLEPFLNVSDREEQGGREERYRTAIGKIKQPNLQQKLKLEMYQWLLSTGRTEDAVYVGLAEVKLAEQKLEEARTLLRQLMFLDGENLDGFSLAAELLEKHQKWEEAIAIRSDLAKRLPWNTANRARLAESELKVGHQENAAKFAAEVLKDQSAEASERAAAAVVHAKGASTSLGPPELIAIQKSVRLNQDLKTEPYAHHLRSTLIKLNNSLSSETIRAELFLYPDGPDLKIPLFLALIREKKCAQALETLDPEQERNGSYIAPTSEQQNEENGDYVQDYNYPVERLHLAEEETARIALQMAECSREEQNIDGEIFFRRMAAAHTWNIQTKQEILALVQKLEKTRSEDQQEESRSYRIALNAGRNS